MSNAAATPRRIMRLPEVEAVTGFGRAWIYHLMSLGQFPKACRIGSRAVGWDSEAIREWIEARLEGRV